jgi:predicted metal-binding membrane protein
MSAQTEPGLVGEWAGHLLLWLAMVAATMLPLIAWNLRGVGLRSPRERRTSATLEVAGGWALVWLAAGVVVSVGIVVSQAAPLVVTVGLVCAVAVTWQFTRIKRIALARCHRRFAPPLGAADTPACLRFGRSLGRDCVLSCWPSMAMMAVAGHQLPAVVALGWLSWRDRRRPHDRPGTVVSVAVLVGVGAFTVFSQSFR